MSLSRWLILYKLFNIFESLFRLCIKWRRFRVVASHDPDTGDINLEVFGLAGNMKIMICLGQGGLHSPSASSQKILISSESFIVFWVSVLSLLFFFFRIDPLTLQISETGQHWVTKLHSYIDPYPTTCIAHFSVDPDYCSGYRAKSRFVDFPHYLQNLSSDLQLQYL